MTIAGEQAQRTLLDNAPASVAKKLGRGHATVRWHRRKWNTVLGVLAGLALLVLVGWWQSEAITAWLASRVSMETEINIGERALAQLEQEHVLTQEGLAAQTIATIGARLTRGIALPVPLVCQRRARGQCLRAAGRHRRRERRA